jgi:hypothetical protein
MAGLQAYGGASLAGGVGLGGSVSNNAFGTLSSKPGIFGANMGAGAFTPAQMANYINSPELAQQFATKFGPPGLPATVSTGPASSAGFAAMEKLVQSPEMLAQSAVEKAGTTAAQGATQAAAKRGLAGIAQGFGDTARAGLPGGIIGKAAPRVAAMGLMSGVSGAMTPSAGGMAGPDGRIDNSFQGPYYAQDRQRILDPEGPLSSKQRRHFAVDMPEIYNTMGQVVQPGSHTVRGTQIMQPVLNPSAKKAKNDIGKPMYSFMPVTYMGGVDPNEEDMGYADGGEIEMSDGAFVLDARTVSEIGNGSSNAGMEALRRIGGRPIDGPGDGVSDSIPARIGRDQPARVARDEVLMPADAVRRIGKGNPQRGADKLYALMNKAHKARKKAGRGQDTKLVRGLG